MAVPRILTKVSIAAYGKGYCLPTNTFVRLTSMKIGVMDAVIHFNEGGNSRVKVLQSMGIAPG